MLNLAAPSLAREHAVTLPAPRRGEEVATRTETTMVWYVAYGSNLLASRFASYITGGTPTGGSRRNPGARDSTLPRESMAVELPGSVYFALESSMWTGGMAFYDPSRPGTTFGRAYLITVDQLSDVVAQETGRKPCKDLNLEAAVRSGRYCVGPGRYETLVYAGNHAGAPLVTFTAPWSLREVTPSAPSASYLRTLGQGLMESQSWDEGQAAAYLASLPGAFGVWSARDILSFLN